MQNRMEEAKKEINIMKTLNYENIVQFIGSTFSGEYNLEGLPNNLICILFEYCEV